MISIGNNTKIKNSIIGSKNDKEIKRLHQELQDIKKEHSIMKQFIYENGLWEKFLNDDRFIKHLRSE